MLLLRVLVWLVVLVVGVAFTALNAESIKLHYYAGSVDIFLPLLIFLAFLVGVVTAVVFMFPKWWHGRRQIAKLKRQLNKITPPDPTL